MRRQLTAIVEREDNGYVVQCPEVDVASQGVSVAEARANLEEALALYFETASSEEIERRLRTEADVTHVIRQSGLPRSEFE
ncbi:MAG: type II toxin-antitoxin system HicB family antitoxin [Gemmatimonadota bacterium]|nr:type II toxin-antitoxin system HicB family antitoxin [Acidobacteriota bacterium]MDE2984903.1 type II toxin-antitoxin system HicB family antitoxin [Gemmatimonadota bacterium]